MHRWLHKIMLTRHSYIVAANALCECLFVYKNQGEFIMITKLLCSSNWIPVNKTLIGKFGLDCAVMIGELCNEYELWKSKSKLVDDMFYSTRENIQNNTGLNDYFQRKALETLKKAGIIEFVKKGLPAVNYYKINQAELERIFTEEEEYNSKSLKENTDSGEQSERPENNTVNLNNNIIINNNKKENKKNISKDILQNSESEPLVEKKTKLSLYDKCLQQINDFCKYTNEDGNTVIDVELKTALTDYLRMRLEIRDKQLYANQWKGMLNKLKEVSTTTKTDQLDIVKQSIERGYLNFYPVNNTQSHSKTNDFSEAGQVSSKHITEEGYKRQEEFINQLKQEGKQWKF